MSFQSLKLYFDTRCNCSLVRYDYLLKLFWPIHLYLAWSYNLFIGFLSFLIFPASDQIIILSLDGIWSMRFLAPFNEKKCQYPVPFYLKNYKHSTQDNANKSWMHYPYTQTVPTFNFIPHLSEKRKYMCYASWVLGNICYSDHSG